MFLLHYKVAPLFWLKLPQTSHIHAYLYYLFRAEDGAYRCAQYHSVLGSRKYFQSAPICLSQDFLGTTNVLLLCEVPLACLSLWVHRLLSLHHLWFSVDMQSFLMFCFLLLRPRSTGSQVTTSLPTAHWYLSGGDQHDIGSGGGLSLSNLHFILNTCNL